MKAAVTTRIEKGVRTSELSYECRTPLWLPRSAPFYAGHTENLSPTFDESPLLRHCRTYADALDLTNVGTASTGKDKPQISARTCHRSAGRPPPSRTLVIGENRLLLDHKVTRQARFEFVTKSRQGMHKLCHCLAAPCHGILPRIAVASEPECGLRFCLCCHAYLTRQYGAVTVRGADSG